MRAIVVVGLGFGDEGKGSMVDYLTRTYEAGLVVRFNGGYQAAHTVVLPDGRKHIFSQFGAGTLAGAKTYIDDAVIVDPLCMLEEAKHLQEFGIDPFDRLMVSPRCLVATHLHRVMNRLREECRGVSRHGSCLLGIGETRHYWLKFGSDAIRYADLRDYDLLYRKLQLLQSRLLLEATELRPTAQCASEYLDGLSELRQHDVADEVSRLFRAAEKFQSIFGLQVATAIFEGAQGVLLDEHHGFHPHTTWSDTTPAQALQALCRVCRGKRSGEYAVVGVTRAYTTRHGDGPMPTSNLFSDETLIQKARQDNEGVHGRGSFRAGPLDLPLLTYALRICREYAVEPQLAVTCTDHLVDLENAEICRTYEQNSEAAVMMRRLPLYRDSIAHQIITSTLAHAKPVISKSSLFAELNEHARVAYASAGPTHENKFQRRELVFRSLA